jgi:peptidoglycan hydrolase CwlO-like protein
MKYIIIWPSLKFIKTISEMSTFMKNWISQQDSHLNEKSQELANLERVVNSLNEKIHDIR